MILIKFGYFIIFRFDDGRDGFLDLAELKRMMEVLGAPQTHLGLKAMIKEVDEDGDSQISFREVISLMGLKKKISSPAFDLRKIAQFFSLSFRI